MKLSLVSSALILLSTAAVSSARPAACNDQTDTMYCGGVMDGPKNTFSCRCVPKNSASLSASAAEFVAVSHDYDSEDSPHTFEEWVHGYEDANDNEDYEGPDFDGAEFVAYQRGGHRGRHYGHGGMQYMPQYRGPGYNNGGYHNSGGYYNPGMDVARRSGHSYTGGNSSGGGGCKTQTKESITQTCCGGQKPTWGRQGKQLISLGCR
jgi:hypothetical protein